MPSNFKKCYTSYYNGEYCKINFQNDKIYEMYEDLGWCQSDFTNCFAVYEVLDSPEKFMKFLKVSRTFQARKADGEASIWLFLKADLLILCFIVKKKKTRGFQSLMA